MTVEAILSASVITILIILGYGCLYIVANNKTQRIATTIVAMILIIILWVGNIHYFKYIDFNRIDTITQTCDADVIIL